MRGMPRVTVRWRRTAVTACSIWLRVVGGEVVEIGGDSGDEPADPGDLLGRGRGLGSCPVVDIGAGQELFPVAEQVVEVGVQVGEVGDVGAEVVAAGAAEPVGQACPPAFTLDGSVQIPNGTAPRPATA